MRRWIGAVAAFCLLTFAAATSQPQESKYHFRDKPFTNITTPQPVAQVVSPEVLQLGTQDQAIKDIDDRIADIKSTIDGIQADMKPLQETDTRIRFLAQICAWAVGILVTSGLAGFLASWLIKRKKSPPPPMSMGTIGM